jgi:lipopolysaccharide assembly outer membrane protein LptD (OstA)
LNSSFTRRWSPLTRYEGGPLALALLLIVFSVAPAEGQIITPFQADSLSPTDTLVIPPDSSRSESTLDSIITYSADTVFFTFEPRLTRFRGDAKVAYKSMELTAGQIDINWDEDMLSARPIVDTLRTPKPPSLIGDTLKTTVADSLQTNGIAFDSLTSPVTVEVKPDSIVVTGMPKMADGTQVIEGETMSYNLSTKRGKVTSGKTDYGDGFYHGEAIKRIDSGTYNIRDGFYTTCDAEEPHYGFWSYDMKMMVKDKIIARPVVLEFGPVPVMMLPFGVFPARGGRHSGILVPTYGESGGQGRYFTGLGYYYAPNDYYDVRGSLDYYERYGILIRGDANYALRYKLNGGASGSYINQNRGGQILDRWDLKVDHSQALSPSSNLNVNAYFVSDKSYLRDVSRNLNERLKQTIRSDAILNKTWPGTPYSASMNLHREQDLSTGNSDWALPRASFSRSQTPVIPPDEGVKPDEQLWFNKVYYRYSGSGVNSGSTRYYPQPDSSELRVSRARGGINHDVGFTASQTVFSYFTLTPGIGYREAWFDEWIDYRQNSDGSVDSVKQKSFRARRTFNGGAGLSTRLYGLFSPKVGRLEAIRHTLSPSISYSYTPDFSDGKWDYFEVFRNSAGREVFYDRFAGNVIGATPRLEQQSMGITVNNLFEYKRRVGDKEQKGELFTLNLSTAHNFTADSLKWSDLGSRLHIKPLVSGTGGSISGLGLDVTTGHSFYSQEQAPGGRWITVNRGARNGLRLTSIDLVTSFRMQGGRGGSAAATTRDTTSTFIRSQDRFTSDEWRPTPAPWSAGVDLRYGENRSNPDQTIKNSTAGVNFELQATRNWKMSGHFSVDLIHKEIVQTGLSLYRDLHCWEGKFTWNPVGVGSGYYLIISVKSPNLQDVKVEKRRGGGGVFGF